MSKPRVLIPAAYILLTLLMTWPLAAGLTRDVPGDLGDSLLNMWILGWGAEKFPRVLAGGATLQDVWNANIFHPEPLALSFSEHLFGEVLQILPIYYLTGNLILCYNLLFLSSFVLSGLGMYLLVRDVAGDRRAAFVAGLVYAFVPLRVSQLAHIQSVSSQWMPFVLYGFRRYIATNRIRALAGGTAALLMQNWSCGYYLMYFAPFVPLFVAHQIWAADRLREWRVWTMFALAGLVTVIGTWPFLSLYLEAKEVHGFERPLAEIVNYSADVYGYLTAPEALRLWGQVLRAWPRPEGDVFLGAVPVILAIAGMTVGAFTARRRLAEKTPVVLIRFVLAVLALGLALGGIAIVFTGGFVTSLAGIPIRATNAPRLLLELTIALAVLLAISPRLRESAARFLRSSAGLSLICLILALWLSLGPVPHARGQTISGLGLYGFFLDHVPGFAGLRAPARYSMIAAVYLSLLAGLGLSVILKRTRHANDVVSIVCCLSLLETAFVPMWINQTWGEAGVTPPPRVEPRDRAPAVYRHLASMPGDLVVAEFPFGDPAWELRYVYYSTVHWKRILNGYSGGFPRGYHIRAARLQRIAADPDAAWKTLVDSQTTHAVVHEDAFRPGEAQPVELWLAGRGAREVGRFDRDILYELRGSRD